MKSLMFLSFASVFFCGCASDICDPRHVDDEYLDGSMCANRLERTMSISNKFTAEQNNQIRMAGEAWGAATNGLVKLSFVNGNSNNADVFLTTLEKGVIAGENDGYIQVNSYVPESYVPNSADELMWSIVHELGHSFGMGHSKNSTTIMFPNSHPDMYITQSDVDHFNSLMDKGIY